MQLIIIIVGISITRGDDKFDFAAQKDYSINVDNSKIEIPIWHS